MAGAFDAKVDISTAEATAGLKALRTEVKNLGPALIELDKIIRNGKQNIVLIAQQFTQLVAVQERAAKAANDVAKADINAARAAGIRNTADAKVAETKSRQANQDAQAARATAQAGTATARTTDITNRGAIATDRHAMATARATAAQNQMHDSMSNSRYLMYDVGATYAVLATGLLAIPAATAAVAAAYQKDFAQVLRVTEDLDKMNGGAQGLKDSLKDLAVSMPVAFDELSRITQLGAQMGVANEKLEQFTETTAKFVAVTGISADSGATLFGRLETSFTDDVAQFPDFFERVGSSIAYVGAKTVATDPEIAAMLNQIGSLGASAGMSAADVTGFAAALASVRVQPELARGTLTRVFGQLNRDVAEGSPRMEEFGKLMNLSGEAAGKLWESDSSEFFQRLLKGLNETHKSGGQLTTTFDLLGIKASRDVSALTKLAVGYEVVDKSMQAANKGFADGTALNEMSKPIFETAVAKLTELANAWKNLGDTLGAGALAPLGVLIDMATNVAIGLDSLIDKVPAIGFIISALMGFATITALFLGFKAAQAFVTAGFIGFQQASQRGVGAGLSLTGTLRQLAVTMLMTKGATREAATGFVEASGAMAGYRVGVASLNGANAVAVTGFAKVKAGARSFAGSLLGLAGGPIGLVIGALALLSGHLISTQVEAEQAGKSIAEAMQQGADTGARAVAEAFNNRKVSFTDGAIGFNSVGQTVTQIAEKAGVGFDKIVGSITKGEQGLRDFHLELERIAKEDGYKDLNEALANPVPGTKAADLAFLNNVVKDYSDRNKDAAKGLAAVEKVAPSAGKAMLDAGDDADEGASGIDKMKDALKALNDEVFGTINAEADLQDALAKIGAGLQKSQSFSPTSEGGRDNIKNVQDALTKARDYYKNLMDTDQLNAQEAAQGYAEFASGLMAEIKNSFGGDTSYIEELAENTRQKFEAAIHGAPVKVPVTTDPVQAQATAEATKSVIQQWYDNNEAQAKVGVDVSDADAHLSDLANAIMEITGLPYSVVLDALTDPASEKAKDVEALLLAITNDTYVAPVDADTTAAITNVQNFVAYARTELAHLQTQLNGGVGLADGEGSMSPAQKAQFGEIAAPKAVKAAPTRAPVQVRPSSQTGTRAGLQGITDGYNKAAEAAKKAGKEGKKAGKDMADGITDAVRAAEDFGNRLKAGMMSAYNQQYGLTKATDEYHSALNAINKKREDELKQVEDLTDKIRELNNERDKELISANKAKIEQNISIKYGEVDRAADYGQQAKEALDNAAAKQKDIVASKDQAAEISAGIGKLDGYSDAAIANREALRNLEVKMIDMVGAYAAQGHSSEEVRRYAQMLTSQFQVDVGQMGFNMAAVGALQGSLERYIGVVDSVPQTKPTEVELNGVDEAMLELAAYGDALRALPDKKVLDVETRVTYGVRKVPSGERVGGEQDANGNWVGGQEIWESYNTSTGASSGQKFFNDGGLIPGRAPSDPRADNLMAKVDGKGMIRVRSREYIQPQEAVDYYGLDQMEAMRTLRMPKFNTGGSPGGSRGSSAGQGSSIVGLDAETLAFFASLKQEVKLYTENRVIAESANEGNKELASEGRS